MSAIDDLAGLYSRHISLPWTRNLAPAQRTIMVVYEPKEERRLRSRLAGFESATHAAGKAWHLVDVSNAFGHWIGQHDYRDAYFESPKRMSDAELDEFGAYVSDWVASETNVRADPDAVVAVVGVGSLFAFTTVRDFVDRLAPEVGGRLLVFFPGSYRNNNYRLLEARDGWNYLATPITVEGT